MKVKQMEKVSVIVPIYNAERYLRQCIDSIINSTYKELEIILVNDGSKDSSLEICKEYAKYDSRIVIINQDNKGISMARNAGLSIATGTYISFVDADDVLMDKFFEKMVRALECSGADWSACNYFTIEEKLNKSSIEDERRKYAIVTGISDQVAVITVAPAMRNQTWTGLPVWNKLYLRSKISFNFEEKRLMGEDLEFNINYCKVAQKMAILDEELYFYRQLEDSTMGNYRAKKDVCKGITSAELWIKVAEEGREYQEKVRKYLEGRAAYMAHGVLWRVVLSGENKREKEFVIKARNYVKNHWIEVWKDKETYELKVRLGIGLCATCFPLWNLMVKII